ncbi:undecaprenyl/decaprenyl-phosphate alpha-N-acetylglucosaminyl 1-phosphate transferase [Candidatus Roizmanbacteria bacterium]|nr:undecaprenyl/decaprenyl-phosphate alpha-N-acetylglucosaminyl 1-phosphate transferase [Candidatus Roizmanbacteria bacterium]
MVHPFWAFSLAFFFSLIFTYPTIFVAKGLDVVTDRRRRTHPAHTHKGVVPRGGGLPLFLSFFLATLLAVTLNKIVFGIVLASFILVVVGLLDDYFDLSPYVRFFVNIAVSVLVISFGLGIPFISNPFGEPIRLDQWRVTFEIFGGKHSFLIVSNLLAIVWLTWTTNMVNWSKGVDGQLPGFVGIAAIFLGLLSQRFTIHDISAQTVMLLSFIIAGSFLGFLPFNMYPQKIMPGYGGGGLAGFWLGILSILSFGKIGTAVLILSVPMIDASYTVLRRIKNRQSPFRADWGHFHHRLLEIGWGRRRIAVFYWVITFVFGIASLFLKGIEKLVAFLSVGIVLIAFIMIINQIKVVHHGKIRRSI